MEDEDLKRRTAIERERQMAWKELGDGLLDWRIARIKKHDLEISADELKLAHRSAYEICRLALAFLPSASDEVERETIRDVFRMTVSTFDYSASTQSLEWLKGFDDQVGDDEVAMKYGILNALLGFPSERWFAIKRMVTLTLPRDLCYSRDGALMACLCDPESGPHGLSLDEQRELASYLREHTIEFGTKKAEKMIKSALKEIG